MLPRRQRTTRLLGRGQPGNEPQGFWVVGNRYFVHAPCCHRRVLPASDVGANRNLLLLGQADAASKSELRRVRAAVVHGRHTHDDRLAVAGRIGTHTTIDVLWHYETPEVPH